jgi:argininosuccinate lyase
MPQKKNPDVPELVRGKAGRVFGGLMSMLTVMKGLPLAYNRDMQEDKAPLFDAVDTLKACIRIYIEMLPRLRFKKEAMFRATRTGYLNATDLADYLVGQGMSFRKAHGTVGKAVAYALSTGKELHDLSLEELKKFSPLIKKDIYQVLATERMVDRRTSAGGTATATVKKAIIRAEKHLSRVKDAI